MSLCDHPGLVPLPKAREVLAQQAERYGVLVEQECIPLASALGRILAQDIVATINVPNFDNSAMDGYALKFSDWQGADGQLTLPVSQRITAGDAPQPLADNSCARIFTGAAMPANADIVIMQEQTQMLENGEVHFSAEGVKHHQNIRPAGQDIKKGTTVFKAGRRLRAEDLGVIASIGLMEITIQRKLKVAVISSGNELVEPGKPLTAGKIYNTNSFTLLGLLQRMDMDVVGPFFVEDDLAETQKVLQQAAQQADVIITSGGVSVGEEDHIKAAICSAGDIELWRLAIKPGKPFALGHFDQTPVLGLPGNPAAVVVTFYQLARDFLHRVQGSEFKPLLSLQGKAAFSTRKAIGRTEYYRARFNRGNIEIYNNQSSGVLSSSSWSDGFACVPAGVQVNEGDEIEFVGFTAVDGQL
jgi:molybdopterin molybdotransferase